MTLSVQLGDGMQIDLAGGPQGQIPGLFAAPGGQQLAQGFLQGILPRRRGEPWPLGHGQVGQFQQFMPAVPGGQPQEGVPAHEQDQGSGHGQFLAQGLQGLHAVAGAGLVNFALVQDETGIARHGPPYHLQPVLGRRPGLAPVRRMPRRDDAHFLKPQQFPHLLRQAQVAIVDGVEGPPEKTDGFSHGRGRLPAPPISGW